LFFVLLNGSQISGKNGGRYSTRVKYPAACGGVFYLDS
jgi:hypothetical protein